MYVYVTVCVSESARNRREKSVVLVDQNESDLTKTCMENEEKSDGLMTAGVVARHAHSGPQCGRFDVLFQHQVLLFISVLRFSLLQIENRS